MSNKVGFGRDASEFLKARGFSADGVVVSAHGIRITAISPTGGDRVTARVTVSNPSGREDREFTVMKAHAEELSLVIGEIDEELLPELEYFAEVAKAYGSACASFAYTPSSYSALYKKLLTKGFPRDVSSDAIDCLRDAGFIKEDEIALRRAQIFVEKRWGRIRIMAKLREEGFSDDAFYLTREFLDNTDFAEICAEHIRKKYGRIPEDDHSRKLMYASLSRMGFSGADIKNAIKLI